MPNTSIRLIHRHTTTTTTTTTDAIIPGQSGPGSNGNERVTPHSPKLQDWSLTIRLFNVMSRTHF